MPESLSRSLAEYGPFFTVSLHTASPHTASPHTVSPHTGPPLGRWRPLAELAGAPELAEWVGRVRAGLGCDRRVAASVAHLGLAARLLSPVLAAAVRHRLLLDLAACYWQPPLSSTVALSVAEPTGGISAEALAHAVAAGPVADLTAAFGRLGSVSGRVLAGNLASAVNGAALQLGPQSWPVAAVLLAGVPGEDGRPGPDFRRRSCCLRYRVAGAGYCGDCVLG
ncbi:MAG TPA: (2Fe-2S)-binding protein [Jatrophihabitans sp.]|nr:(2Fe-2S)-binding protein [Jatrophihabitans sp.]